VLTGSGESTLVNERSATAIVAWLRLISIDETAIIADKSTKVMIAVFFIFIFPADMLSGRAMISNQ